MRVGTAMSGPWYAHFSSGPRKLYHDGTHDFHLHPAAVQITLSALCADKYL